MPRRPHSLLIGTAASLVLGAAAPLVLGGPAVAHRPQHRASDGPAVVRMAAAQTITARPRHSTARTTGHPRHSTAPTPGTGTFRPPATPYLRRPDWANAVLAELNAERADNALKPLKMDTRLVAAAHGHALAMARANQLSHQLPGEASLVPRVEAAGYQNWTALGENIGVSSAQTQESALDLEKLMYAEKPPDDGHRRNILSTGYSDVGIDIVVDAVHHQLWLVTDFGRST